MAIAHHQSNRWVQDFTLTNAKFWLVNKHLHVPGLYLSLRTHQTTGTERNKKLW